MDADSLYNIIILFNRFEWDIVGTSITLPERMHPQIGVFPHTYANGKPAVQAFLHHRKIQSTSCQNTFTPQLEQKEPC